MTYENTERSGPLPLRGLRTPGGAPLPNIPSRLNLRLFGDGAIWFVAMIVGAIVLGASPTHGAVAGGLAASFQLLLGGMAGLYSGRWRLASFDEAVALFAVAAAVASLLGGLRSILAVIGLTVAVDVLAPFVALVLMVAARGVARVLNERRRRSGSSYVDAQPVLIYGAGDGAAQIVRAMLGNPLSTYVPVALLDDDPKKQNLRIQGVPVRGTRDDIAEIAAAFGTEVLVIAIPSAGSKTVSAIATTAEESGLDVRVLPPTQELVDGIVSLSDLREVSVDDLLGLERSIPISMRSPRT